MKEKGDIFCLVIFLVTTVMVVVSNLCPFFLARDDLPGHHQFLAFEFDFLAFEWVLEE